MDRAAAANAFLPAAMQALAGFPVAPGEVSLAAVAENVTFRVEDLRHGKTYALRLHRPGYNDLGELRSEHAWIAALSASGVATPLPVAAADGAGYVQVEVTAEGARFASLTPWVEGRLLSEVLMADPADAMRRLMQLGRLIATMHLQAGAWEAPTDFRRRRLDADGLVGPDPAWGRFWEHPELTAEEAALLARARLRVHAALAALEQTPAAFDLIHADLHPGNVLLTEEQLWVIDFDDAAWGWRLYDLAVALFYQQFDPRFPQLEQALLNGYRDVLPLEPDAARLLPLFRLVRGMAQIGWLGQRPELEMAGYFSLLKDVVCGECRRREALGWR